MSVALICVVSGQSYIRYAEGLFESAEEYLDLPFKSYLLGGREGWPDATLYRYHTILERGWEEDYLFLCDADMLFENDVGEEILGELVATQHPGYVTRKDLPYETRARSAARVLSGDTYYAGGFVGGERETFLILCERIRDQINHDYDHEVMAVWHDESHLNRVLSIVKPSVTLSPSYCYPDDARDYPWLEGLERKLVALDKTLAERVGR